MDFDVLIKTRREFIEKARENNFDFEAILSGLYTDSSHFIFELLQNAEDANANHIEFRLLPNQIEVIHDGDDFTFDDVDGITGIGKPGKREDVNKIGTFGVGFKSVFAISKTPHVHSGKYHFSITDFVLPTIIQSISLGGKTKFVFPFDLESKDPEVIYEKIKTRLENLDLRTLLFLKKIETIQWSTSDSEGSYRRSKKNRLEKNTYKVILSSTNDAETANYILFKQPVTVSKEQLTIEVAYKLDIDENGAELISPISINDSKLVVFFPTERATYLNFLIQAPFKTTPNREGIPLDDPQNVILLDHAAQLVSESIPIIKKLGLLTVSFLQVLPIRDEHCDDEIYSRIFEHVKKTLSSDQALLPTKHGGFSFAEEAALARAKDLATLLTSKDLNTLFQKLHWLNTDITADKTPSLREYLIEHLDIPEYTFEVFSRSIDTEFIRKKSDKWLCTFYKFIIKRPALLSRGYQRIGLLRSKPIIRLSRGKHLEAFDHNGDLQVYLPTPKKTKFNTIKKSIAANKHAKELFKYWDITSVDSYAEIIEGLLPKYHAPETNISLDEHISDLDFIYQYYLTDDNSKWSSLKKELTECPLVLSQTKNETEITFQKPTDVYFQTEDLINYFADADDVFFVSPLIFETFKDEHFRQMLQTLGVNNQPIIYEVDPDFTWQELTKLRTTAGCTNNVSVNDYFMHHFDEFVNDLNINNSVLIWKFLAKIIQTHGNGILHGEYIWYYYNNHYASFPSRFQRQILGCEWLIDQSGTRVSPPNISINDLHSNYPLEGLEYENLISLLDFKLDEVSALEQRTGGKFVTQEEYELFQEWKAEQEEARNEDVEVEISLDDTEIETEEEVFSGESVARPDLRNQPVDKTSSNEQDDTANQAQNNAIAKYSKRTGRWGEQYVYKHLKTKKYAHLKNITDTVEGFKGFIDDDEIEVRWLNKSEDQGKGYDFLILNNGLETSYIEVKATRGGKKELHRVSAAQWGLATDLYNNGEGGRYKLFVVINAGSDKAKIIPVLNPVGLWKDGKLYAHPIHVRV
jgi:hypothetical protein